MRRLLAMVAAGGTGAVGALVLGEYAISGVVGAASGLVLGLLVAEVVLSVAKEGDAALAVVAALGAGGGVIGAGWIFTGHDLGRLDAVVWAAAALAVAAAGVRVWPARLLRRTRPASAPEP